MSFLLPFRRSPLRRCSASPSCRSLSFCLTPCFSPAPSTHVSVAIPPHSLVPLPLTSRLSRLSSASLPFVFLLLRPPTSPSLLRHCSVVISPRVLSCSLSVSAPLLFSTRPSSRRPSPRAKPLRLRLPPMLLQSLSTAITSSARSPSRSYQVAQPDFLVFYFHFQVSLFGILLTLTDP